MEIDGADNAQELKMTLVVVGIEAAVLRWKPRCMVRGLQKDETNEKRLAAPRLSRGQAKKKHVYDALRVPCVTKTNSLRTSKTK